MPRWNNPNCGFQKGYKPTKKHRELTKKAVIKRWENPEYRKHMSEIHKGQKVGKMEKNPNWKGGKIIHRQGYILVYRPEHPSCKKTPYMLRSRLVMEQMIKRLLKPKEVVHHRGVHYPLGSIENRQDDSPENLQLFKNNSEHLKFHHSKGK